jgi:hypothetical protein
LMIIEAAGCLKTYEKTSVGHECTTLVMDKYKEVKVHTDMIRTTVFPDLMGRPHAAPVVRGVFLLEPSSSLKHIDAHDLGCSVSPKAEAFWKVSVDFMMMMLLQDD